MKNTDPKELSGFRSMDDSPENDGMNFNDYNPPRATWANKNDEPDDREDDGSLDYNWHNEEMFD